MGDYAITKVILKVKKECQKPLKDFIDIEKSIDWENQKAYSEFWNSLGVSSFYYERFVFGQGSFHAYTTALGKSEVHKESDFYIDDQYTTRFEDGFWFVEFSSKVAQHRHFLDKVVPSIADAWIGLYGDEYSYKPEKIEKNKELIFSFNPSTQTVIDNFLDQYNKEYIDPEAEYYQNGMWGAYLEE